MSRRREDIRFADAAHTKQGKHGTLHRHVVKFSYNDPSRVPDEELVWGYDWEHAVERFQDSCEDQGFEDIEVLNVRRLS